MYNIIGLLVSLAIAFFLYTDAKKTGRNEILWGVLGFFFSLLTLIVYFIVKATSKNDVWSTIDFSLTYFMF